MERLSAYFIKHWVQFLALGVIVVIALIILQPGNFQAELPTPAQACGMTPGGNSLLVRTVLTVKDEPVVLCKRDGQLYRVRLSTPAPASP